MNPFSVRHPCAQTGCLIGDVACGDGLEFGGHHVHAWEVRSHKLRGEGFAIEMLLQKSSSVKRALAVPNAMMMGRP